MLNHLSSERRLRLRLRQLLHGGLSPRSCPRSTRGGPAACAGTSTATRATTSARPRAWWSPWWRTSGTRGSCTRTAPTCGSSTATPASSTRAWVREPAESEVPAEPRGPHVPARSTGRGARRWGREALGFSPPAFDGPHLDYSLSFKAPLSGTLRGPDSGKEKNRT